MLWTEPYLKVLSLLISGQSSSMSRSAGPSPQQSNSVTFPHFLINRKSPVKAGDEAGEAVYMLDGQEVGRMKVVAAEDVPASGYLDYLIYICMQMVVT